jgi:peptide/nickel transport system substrate-binding protein
MRKSVMRRALGALLAFALLATACGDDDDDDEAGSDTGAATTSSAAASTTDGGAAADSTTTAASEDTAGTDTTAAAAEDEPRCDATVPGTQINFGVFSPTSALYPPGVSGSVLDGTENAAIYDVLFRYDYEAKQYVPQVAESMTPNDDFTEWTLKLRDGMTYSNGDPFDVDNLLAYFELYFGQGVRNAGGGSLSVIETSEKIDDTTVVFHLSKPWASFVNVLADETGMVVNTRVLPEDRSAFGLNPPPEAGVGPYVVERFTPGSELVLRARDDYWGGPVCVERIRFVFVPGPAATYDAYKAGDLDIAFIRDVPVLERARDDGETVISDVQDAGLVLMMNMREGSATADPLVREAAVLAIDESILNDRAYEGLLTTSRSLINPESPFASDALEQAPYDPDRAAEILEQAKAAGYDGRIRVMASNAPPNPDVVIATEAMLEAVGFDVEQVLLPANESAGRVVTGDYDVVSWGWVLGAAPGEVYSLLFNFASDSSTNRIAYANPAMDAALDELLAAPTPEAHNAALAEVNNLLVEDFVGLPFAQIEGGAVVSPDVEGAKLTITQMFLLDDVSIAT